MLMPDDFLDKGFKTVSLSFVLFFHYVLTMLMFFVPIDVAHKIFGIPQMPSILFGAFTLYLWSIASAWALVKSYGDENDRKR